MKDNKQNMRNQLLITTGEQKANADGFTNQQTVGKQTGHIPQQKIIHNK